MPGWFRPTMQLTGAGASGLSAAGNAADGNWLGAAGDAVVGTDLLADTAMATLGGKMNPATSKIVGGVSRVAGPVGYGLTAANEWQRPGGGRAAAIGNSGAAVLSALPFGVSQVAAPAISFAGTGIDAWEDYALQVARPSQEWREFNSTPHRSLLRKESPLARQANQYLRSNQQTSAAAPQPMSQPAAANAYYSGLLDQAGSATTWDQLRGMFGGNK